MKKKLSLLLAATMVLGMMPVSAFATTTNSVSKVVTVKDDGDIDTEFVIEEKEATPWSSQEQFELSLNNSKWEKNTRGMSTSDKFYFTDKAGAPSIDGQTANDGKALPVWGVKGYYRVLDDSTILMTIDGSNVANEAIFRFPVKAEADGKGDCTITVDPMSSRISGGTYTIASALGGATKTTISKTTDIQEGGTEIKNLVISEVTPGSLKKGKDIKVKLTGDYEWDKNKTTISIVAGDVDQTVTPVVYYDGETKTPPNIDKSTLAFELDEETTTEAYKIVIGGLFVKPTDDAEYGETVEVTISGASMTKETIEVGKYVDYGYTWKAEDKDIPVVYSGRTVRDDDILKATFKETIANSWLNGRKTTIEFPDGIKIIGVSIDPTDVNVSQEDFSVNTDTEVDGNKLTLTSSFVNTQREGNKKAELEFTFDLAIAPDFVGDLTATVSGSGVSNQESSVTIAKVEAPVTAKTEANEVKIDYRNTAINDIIITEAYPGALKKGTTLRLQAEQMQFEDGVEYEVTSGDLKVDKITVSKRGNTSNSDGGTIDIKIKSESAKEAGVIKLSNIQLYLQRSLPAGDYALYYVPFETPDKSITGSTPATDVKEVDNNAFFRTYDDDGDNPFFDTDQVKAVEKFLTVITAGRDVDDSTFTTKVSVTIGASEMKAGERTIPLDVPAYISADGYTMLPLRAVTEALSDRAIINWDDATRTVTIIFGSRIISMTVGSNVMTINGTAVAMSAKVEITGERSFVPLRDLGIALGVNETLINWDAATKTATLN